VYSADSKSRLGLDGKLKQTIFAREEGYRQAYYYQYYKGYIYYKNVSDNNHLYRINLDGTEDMMVSTNTANRGSETSDFIIYNDYIYYTVQLKERYLYRMNLDGTSNELVVNHSIAYFNLYDGFLYFVSAEGIYKAELNGQNVINIFNKNILENISILGDYIYAHYRPYDILEELTRDDYQQLLIKTDGSMQYVILDE